MFFKKTKLKVGDGKKKHNQNERKGRLSKDRLFCYDLKKISWPARLHIGLCQCKLFRKLQGKLWDCLKLNPILI